MSGKGDREPRREDIPDNELECLFNRLDKALRVYANDYFIIQHPKLKLVSPFAEPNEGYSVTSLENVNVLEFVGKISKVEQVIITCMDKDVAHKRWQMAVEEVGGDPSKVMMLTMGGGIVQHGEERVEAMKQVADGLAKLRDKGLMDNLKKVCLEDHNHTCGAVKHWLKADEQVGVALVDLVKRELGIEIYSRGEGESKIMAALIRGGYCSSKEAWESLENNGVEVVLGLFDTQRLEQEDVPWLLTLGKRGVFAYGLEELGVREKLSAVIQQSRDFD